MKVLLRSASLLALAAAALAAHADVLIGNLSGPVGSSTVLEVGASAAMGFTTPAGLPSLLTGATLRLQYLGYSTTLRIYNNSAADNPGTPLATLLNDPAAQSNDSYSFAPTAPFLFAPSTTYWLVLSNNDAGAGGGAYWKTTTLTPTGAATHFGSRIGNSTPPTGGFSALSSYAIAVNPTPEPSALAALGLGAVAMLKRHKRA